MTNQKRKKDESCSFLPHCVTRRESLQLAKERESRRRRGRASERKKKRVTEKKTLALFHAHILFLSSCRPFFSAFHGELLCLFRARRRSLAP